MQARTSAHGESIGRAALGRAAPSLSDIHTIPTAGSIADGQRD
jgi:hypothetical protein